MDEREGLLDGYFHSAVETSVGGVKKRQVWVERERLKTQFTFKVIASSSVGWRRWLEGFGGTPFSSCRSLKSLPRVAE